jgi:hypothetical protein
MQSLLFLVVGGGRSRGIGRVVTLGKLKVHRMADGRYFVVIPPSPLVRSLAGRFKLSFVAEVEAHSCQDASYHENYVSFSAKITAVRRSDGSFWYRVLLPSRHRDVWSTIYNCGYVKLKVIV